MTRLFAAVATLLLLATSAHAATYTATDCSRANVQTKIDLATHGDTVNVASGGTSSYTAYLRVQKNITLDLTGCTIQDNVTKDSSYASGWLWYTVTPTSTTSAIARITGNAMQGIATDPSVYNKGHIVIDGSSGGVSANFRLDHLTVTTPQTSLIRTYGWVWGVIDHVTMTGSFQDILQAGHDAWGGSTFGDGSWAAALTPGTAQALYVEDCTLTAAGNPYVTNFADGLDGARVVIRYSTFTQGNVTSHGTDTGGRRRGIRWQEVYNNTFLFPAGMPADFIAWLRGGSGVMYSNTVTATGGINFMAKVHNYRDDNTVGLWGLCDGTSPYDQNSVGQTGYRCVDQPGAGTSNNLAGVDPPPSVWVGNTLEPIYVWGNTLNGVSNNSGSFGGGSDGHVVVNRDVYFGTARPGYTAYTYPHPLTQIPATTYTITASSGSNGSISPSGAVVVSSGASQAFTLTPSTGYHVASLLVDGVSVGTPSSYTFSNVTGDHTIAATFAINTYTITATFGAHGTVAPSVGIVVNYGGSQAFTITADASYHVADVLVDGVSVGAVTGYTFSNVTANHTISATFALNDYTITGTITLSGSPLANVSLAGATCTVTNALGQYSCGVSSGFSGAIAPSLMGYLFTPASRSYVTITTNQSSQNYTAATTPTSPTTTRSMKLKGGITIR